MSEDASLDDFLGTGGSEGSDGETSESADSVEAGATATEADEPAAEPGSDQTVPAETTYAWDGAGAACDSCDEVVERRWQQDGGLVCVACKDWERA